MPDVLDPQCPRSTEDQLVKYLYFIVDSLAKTKKYFPRYSDYDDYALYCAGEYFIIFRNKSVTDRHISFATFYFG